MAALKFWTDWFVVWVVLFSVAAFALPEVFTPLRAYIVPGLGVIMFGMGTAGCACYEDGPPA